MKRGIVAALIVLALIGTFFIFRAGVKRAVDLSFTKLESIGDSSHSKDASEAENANRAAPTQNHSEPTAAGNGTSHEVAPSGSTAATAQNGGHASSQPVEVKAAPDKNCFAFEYRHTKEAKNKDIEDFLDFSNAFALLHKNVNQKSICVKVNGKPVAFKLSKNQGQDEVMIGSVVGPESTIRVSYCTGSAPCKESCAVKSNRFMDDLMSDTGEDDDFKDSWDSAEKPSDKKELKARVKELRTVASENSEMNKHSVIRTWDTVKKDEWVCKK